MEQRLSANHLRLQVSLLVAFAVTESAMIWWRITAAPLAWICFVWLMVSLVLFIKDRRSVGKLIWPNLAALLLAIGAVECMLYVSKHSNPYLMPPDVRFVGDLARPNYFIEMPIDGLGYRPRPNMQIQAIKMQRDNIIYSVRYNVGSDGLRISPPVSGEVRACVFMFGDSMAWGEGVDDDQTTAYQIGLKSNLHLKVSNFAFTGYSAHQMLWQVNTGIVEAQSGCPKSLPVLAIYQTLPNNVARVAGLRGWDEFGPRYIVDADGKPQYAGSFKLGDMVLHDRYRVPSQLSTQLDRINLYSRIFGRDRNVDTFDYERFANVVHSAATRMKTTFPHLQFIVLVWPEPGEVRGDATSGSELLRAKLQRHGIEAITIDAIIPWYRDDTIRAVIAGDGHPNQIAHQLIAEYFTPQVERLAQVTQALPAGHSLVQK